MKYLEIFDKDGKALHIADVMRSAYFDIPNSEMTYATYSTKAYERSGKRVIRREKTFKVNRLREFTTVVELFAKKTIEGDKILHKVTTTLSHYYEQIDFVESKDLEECVKKHELDAKRFAEHYEPEEILLTKLDFM